MHSWLDLRRLRYLVAIVENGSFSEAARVLNIAQPALTHHLREMERGYGGALLVRSHKGVTMTPAGEILFTYAKSVLALLTEANAELENLNKEKARILRVGIISSLSSAVTPRLLSAAAKEMPSIGIHISEKSVHESYELIAEGKLDCAITLDFHEWKQSELLVHEELFFVSAPAAAASDMPMALHELAQHKLILPSFENSVLRPSLEALAKKNGMRLSVPVEIDGLSPRKEAVIAGLGVTVLPIVSILADVLARNLVLRPFEPRITRRIVLKLRDGLDAAIVSTFREILVRVLGDVTRYP